MKVGEPKPFTKQDQAGTRKKQKQRRAKLERERGDHVRALAADNDRCMFVVARAPLFDIGGEWTGAVFVQYCAQPAADVHEVQQRGAGGSITAPENTIPLCREHHNHIENSPAWSRENGYILKRYE